MEIADIILLKQEGDILLHAPDSILSSSRNLNFYDSTLNLKYFQYCIPISCCNVFPEYFF